MIVPHDRLSPEALAAVMEEYVTRDGTELTDAETKIEQVREALKRGELVLVFDAETETCNFVAHDAAQEASTPDSRSQVPGEGRSASNLPGCRPADGS